MVVGYSYQDCGSEDSEDCLGEHTTMNNEPVFDKQQRKEYGYKKKHDVNAHKHPQSTFKVEPEHVYINESAEEDVIANETLQKMMDAKKLSEKAFFLHDIPPMASFCLAEDEWKGLLPGDHGNNRLDPSWTDVISKHMAESNSFCTFHFSWHYLQKANSLKKNNTYVFSAKERCTFEDCPVHFSVHMAKENLED